MFSKLFSPKNHAFVRWCEKIL